MHTLVASWITAPTKIIHKSAAGGNDFLASLETLHSKLVIIFLTKSTPDQNEVGKKKKKIERKKERPENKNNTICFSYTACWTLIASGNLFYLIIYFSAVVHN